MDDPFHRGNCSRAGKAFARPTLRQNKAHMDRVRVLSLTFVAQAACDDHFRLLQAIRARVQIAAMTQRHSHLGRLGDQIRRIRAGHEACFEGAPNHD